MCAVSGKQHSSIEFLRRVVVGEDKWDGLAAALRVGWDEATLDVGAIPWTNLHGEPYVDHALQNELLAEFLADDDYTVGEYLTASWVQFRASVEMVPELSAERALRAVDPGPSLA